ncbi:hypothetical protein Fmac_024852 [Flemingia macrophylla]|uniref:Uncharacterized protein n=1 Tax=Flemingia macrophylla TaxID=520843 RepID=A0ABD1LQJ6_9FABA
MYIASHVVNSFNDNGIVSCTETARSWKPSSLSSVLPRFLWWPTIDVCSISLGMLIHSSPLLVVAAIDVCSISLRMLIHSSLPSTFLVSADVFVATSQTPLMTMASFLAPELLGVGSHLHIKCLASAAMVACYTCLQHKPQDAHSLQVATKKDRLFFSARNDVIVNRGAHDVATDTSAETRKVEGKLDAFVNLVTQGAVNQKPASVARQPGVNEHPEAYAANIYRVHDLATDTSAETRKVEGKLDALVNLVTQLAQPGVNEHPEAYAANIYSRPPKGVHDVATDTSVETRKVEGKLDALMNLVTQLAVNQKPFSVERVCGIRSSNDHHTTTRWLPTPRSFSARNDAIGIRGVHDVATDIAAETRKVEGKLDSLVNLVTQLAVNQKPASVARVHCIRSSNDHHTNRRWLRTPSNFSARNDAIVLRGVHNVATDTAFETRKVEGKLDALVNLVTQLAVNQKPAFVARVYGIRSSNDHHTNVYTSAKTRKVEDKLDPLVNLVTQLAVNQKPVSAARQPVVNEHPEAYAANIYSRPPQQGVHDVATIHLLKLKGGRQARCSCEIGDSKLAVNRSLPLLQEFVASVLPMTTIQIGVHNVATDIVAETRKVEGKLDALVNLHPEAYAAKSITGHHSSSGQILDREDSFQLLAVSIQEIMPLSLEDFTAWLWIHLLKLERSSRRGYDTSAETKKVEGKLDALVMLVTQLAVNQKPASVARVCHHSSRGQTLDKEDGFQLLAIWVQEMMPLSLEEFTTRLQILLLKLESARNDAIVIRGVLDVATDTSAETRKVEGNLDAIVNLVTQVAVNQKPASVARVCGIRSSNDHHTNVCPSSARNDAIVIRGVHDVTTDTSAETRKVQGMLDALVNLQPGVNDVRNDAIVIRGVHDVATDTSSQTRKVEGKLEALVNWCFSARNDAIVIRGVHDLATDTSSKTRKVEGKLDALVNFVTQLAVNQKPASVARVCDIRSSKDHHTNVYPSFFNTRNDATVIRGVHDVATDTSAETRKVEGKVDALENLVTQLAVNRSLPLLQESVASVRPMTTIQMSVVHHSNLELMSILRLMLQASIVGHHSSRGQTLDRQDDFQLIVVSVQEMISLSLEEFTTWLQIHLLKLESLSLLQEFVASVRPMTTIQMSVALHSNLEVMSILRGVHDVATDIAAETRKVEGKLDALVNLVTQLAMNQKPASVARVHGIHSSNDHQTNVCPSLGVHDVATDTSAETRKVEGKLDALVNLVTQLFVNRSLPLLQESMASVFPMTTIQIFNTRNNAIGIRGVHDVATYTSAQTRKVEGKLDALVNLVTRLV